MGKVVSISFAGKQPCKDCGSTTTRRGWVSSTDEISCATRSACEKRQLVAWKAKHPECYALDHRPVPGGFCASCRPAWAGGPCEEVLCPNCRKPLNNRPPEKCQWSACRLARRRAREAARRTA